MTRRQFQGFTLTELTIVVLFLATLFALAIPAYQDYVVRMQVTEGANPVQSYAPPVRDNLSNTDNLTAPSTLNQGVGMPRSGQYADSFAMLSAGTIEITFNGPKTTAPIKGTLLDFIPNPNVRGEPSWKCAAPAAPAISVPQQYWPMFCRR
jgi:type IV pilus assembly protein PilA